MPKGLAGLFKPTNTRHDEVDPSLRSVQGGRDAVDAPRPFWVEQRSQLCMKASIRMTASAAEVRSAPSPPEDELRTACAILTSCSSTLGCSPTPTSKSTRLGWRTRFAVHLIVESSGAPGGATISNRNNSGSVDDYSHRQPALLASHQGQITPGSSVISRNFGLQPCLPIHRQRVSRSKYRLIRLSSRWTLWPDSCFSGRVVSGVNAWNPLSWSLV